MWPANAISAVIQTTELRLPFGSAARLASPSGSYILYGIPGPELWIENSRTGKHRRVLATGGTLQAKWSPDGMAFSVNDHRSSDSSLAYLYTAATLKRKTLRSSFEILIPGSNVFSPKLTPIS